jgi:hypothetical protein
VRVLFVLLAIGLGCVFMGLNWARAKLSPGSVHDYDYRIERAWDPQQKSIGAHGYQSEEYMRRQAVYDRLKAERESRFGKKPN